MHLGSLESTQEARVALGYRLEQLLRFFRVFYWDDDRIRESGGVGCARRTVEELKKRLWYFLPGCSASEGSLPELLRYFIGCWAERKKCRRWCAVLEMVLLKGEKNSSHAHKTGFRYLLRVLKISDDHPCSFYIGATSFPIRYSPFQKTVDPVRLSLGPCRFHRQSIPQHPRFLQTLSIYCK